MKSEIANIYNYTVIFEKEKEGGYHAFCPILKGCHSQCDNFEEAVENITEAVGLYLESLKEDNLPIPKEDLVFKSVQIAG